jgi:hypothetical protein
MRHVDDGALMVPITIGARAFLYTAVYFAVVLVAAKSATAFELITAAEAALPPGKVRSVEVRGSPTRRPSITLISPSGAGGIYSPLDFKLRFNAFGGAGIDPNSVVVTYIKQPDIDITARVKAFISANGIDIAQAEVPPGLHEFWIELMDSNGNSNGREVEFLVVK